MLKTCFFYVELKDFNPDMSCLQENFNSTENFEKLYTYNIYWYLKKNVCDG